MAGIIKRSTTNYKFGIPFFDAPNWGAAVERNFNIIDAVLALATSVNSVVGEWTNNTEYDVGDRVIDPTDNTVWTCDVAHTSSDSGVFADERAAHPTYWAVVNNRVVVRGEFNTGTDYEIGDFVMASNEFLAGVVNTAFTGGATLRASIGNLDVIYDLASLGLPANPGASTYLRRNAGNTGYDAISLTTLRNDIAALPLAGGTLTGALTVQGEVFIEGVSGSPFLSAGRWMSVSSNEGGLGLIGTNLYTCFDNTGIVYRTSNNHPNIGYVALRFGSGGRIHLTRADGATSQDATVNPTWQQLIDNNSHLYDPGDGQRVWEASNHPTTLSGYGITDALSSSGGTISGNLSITGSLTLGGTLVSPFIKGMLDDANAAAVLTTLGVSSFIQTLLNDSNAAAARATIGALGATAADVVSINGGPLNGFRNKIINGDFDIWQRGTSFTPTTGAYTADRWVHGFDGSGSTRTISRQTHTLGQTAVPGNPKYFLRHAQTVAGSGGTYNQWFHKIEGAQTLAGKTVTLTLYAKAGSAMTLPSIQLGQVFGSGGSPSASTNVDVATNIAIGTSFQKLQYTAALPSVTGKTLGTNGDDALWLIINLPLNATFTFDIAHVSLVEGDATSEDDPFSPRHIAQELLLCERYYRVMGMGLGVTAFGTTGVVAGITFNPPMRVRPTTIPLAPCELNMPGYSNFTGGNVTATVQSEYGGISSVGGFTGLTSHASGFVTNDCVAFDAEL